MAVEKFKVVSVEKFNPADTDSFKELKGEFAKCKNPKSTCPYKDGHEVSFEEFQVIAWQHPKLGSGKYIAIKFKEYSEPLSVSAPLKSVTAYSSASAEDMEDIVSVGGLSDIIRNNEWSDNLLDLILEFFKDKVTIKLTSYYVPLANGARGKRNLINVVKKTT